MPLLVTIAGAVIDEPMVEFDAKGKAQVWTRMEYQVGPRRDGMNVLAVVFVGKAAARGKALQRGDCLYVSGSLSVMKDADETEVPYIVVQT